MLATAAARIAALQANADEGGRSVLIGIVAMADAAGGGKCNIIT
jgi:hypothetical protein